MERKNRNWLYLVPVAGAVFCLWYLYTSFYDVVYSDYIRLVNSHINTECIFITVTCYRCHTV